jgi:hypothetical protein
MLSRSYDPSWGFDKLVRFDPSKFNTLLSQYKKKDGILNFFFLVKLDFYQSAILLLDPLI